MHKFWVDISLAEGGRLHSTHCTHFWEEGLSEGTRPQTGYEQINTREFDKGEPSQEKVYFPAAPLKKPEALASS